MARLNRKSSTEQKAEEFGGLCFPYAVFSPGQRQSGIRKLEVPGL